MSEFRTPYAEAAEQAVIGCAIEDTTLAGELKSRWFYNDQLRTLADAMRDMARRGEPITEASTFHRLGTWCIGVFSQCRDACDHPNYWSYWRGIVEAKAKLRDLHGFLATSKARVESAGQGGTAEADDAILAEIENAYVTLSRSDDATKHEKTAMECIDALFAELDRGVPPDVIHSGLASFDRFVDLAPGQLAVIGARPGLGKTSLAGRIVEDIVLNQGRPVGFVSLEMSCAEIMRRMASGLSGVPHSDFKRPSQAQHDPICDALGRLKRAPLWISDRGGMTLSDVGCLARRWKVRHSIDVLVIDYLQLIQPDNRKASRYEAVSEASATMKRIARDLNVLVILLAQLNREAAGDDEKPRLHHLRDSGSIEQDADVVGLLHVVDVGANGTDRKVDLLIEKNRHGPLGVAGLNFTGTTMRFESRSPLDEPPTNESKKGKRR